MIVEFFCPRWGYENIEWDTFFKSVKDAGYKGIEWFPFGENADIGHVVELLKKYDLKFAIVMTVQGNFPDFSDYLLGLEQNLTKLCRIGKSIGGPLFISAQVGREYFTDAEIDQCISCCSGVSFESAVPVYHETHRNKWSFAAHVVAPVLKRNQQLLLTLDISHWFCVSESYLEDQQEAVESAIKRTRHLHARIGHTQGSQVIDPSLPQYKEALQAHLNVWDKWIALRKQEGVKVCTITPEFGPPPYLISLREDTDVAKQQWNLNLWMKDLLDKRYNI